MGAANEHTFQPGRVVPPGQADHLRTPEAKAKISRAQLARRDRHEKRVGFIDKLQERVVEGGEITDDDLSRVQIAQALEKMRHTSARVRAEGQYELQNLHAQRTAKQAPLRVVRDEMRPRG